MSIISTGDAEKIAIMTLMKTEWDMDVCPVNFVYGINPSFRSRFITVLRGSRLSIVQ
jgi:hypothetical protein